MKQILTLLIALFIFNYAHSQKAEEYYYRGLEKSELAELRGAIADFTKAIVLNPKYADAYFYRGLAKSKLEDRRGAIADFNKTIALNPNYEEAYYYRGIEKIITGQKKSGCLDLSKAAELGYEDAYDLIEENCK